MNILQGITLALIAFWLGYVLGYTDNEVENASHVTGWIVLLSFAYVLYLIILAIK